MVILIGVTIIPKHIVYSNKKRVFIIETIMTIGISILFILVVYSDYCYSIGNIRVC